MMSREAIRFLDDLLAQLQAVLGPQLVGLYVGGSLATGAFDAATSDIDFVVAISTDLDQQTFRHLDQVHADLLRHYPHWTERIEIAYLSTAVMREIHPDAPIAMMSPGESFHIKEAGSDWLINLYVLQEHGIPRFGPPPHTLIHPIQIDDLLRAQQPLMHEWRDWVQQTDLIYQRQYQGHMIITMCRNLYLFTQRSFATKSQATAWAIETFPPYAPLIQDALAWRASKDTSVAVDTLPSVLQFVNFAIDTILAE